MNRTPHEFALGGIYLPPLMVASLLALMITVVLARLLNKYRISRYFFYPPLAFVAMLTIFTVLVGTFILPV